MVRYEKAAIALDELLYEVYGIAGQLDDLNGHPLFTEREAELVMDAFRIMEEASNEVHDRLRKAEGEIPV